MKRRSSHSLSLPSVGLQTLAFLVSASLGLACDDSDDGTDTDDADDAAQLQQVQYTEYAADEEDEVDPIAAQFSGEDLQLQAVAKSSGASRGAARFAAGNGHVTEQGVLSSAVTNAQDQLGAAVAIDGDTAFVGSEFVDVGTVRHPGAVFIFNRTGSTWSAGPMLSASDAVKSDRFGSAIGLDGTNAIIGAYGADDNGKSSGAAYIFADSAGWAEDQKLIGSDTVGGDYFGFDVAIDGDVAIVGAYRHDGTVGDNSGAAYIFRKSGASWVQEAKLVSSDLATNDNFGISVAIDGDRAVVGAWRNDAPSVNSGAAYVFEFAASTWTQTDKLVASDGAEADYFGTDVAVSGDRIVVGAIRDDDNGANSGSAYVYDLAGPNNWVETKLLPTGGASVDYFGEGVAVDGDQIVIGAHRQDDDGENAGAVFVFGRNRDGTYNEQRFSAATSSAGDHFGRAVDIDDDSAVVGARWHAVGGAGTSRDGAGFGFKVALDLGDTCGVDGVCLSGICEDTFRCESACPDGFCDNTGSCIEDTEDPVLTIPPDTTIANCDTSMSDAALFALIGEATATDNSGQVEVTHDFDTLNFVPGQTVDLTWTATDSTGNTATGTQTLTVKLEDESCCPASSTIVHIPNTVTSRFLSPSQSECVIVDDAGRFGLQLIGGSSQEHYIFGNHSTGSQLHASHHSSLRGYVNNGSSNGTNLCFARIIDAC